jgi:hypothetical protein
VRHFTWQSSAEQIESSTDALQSFKQAFATCVQAKLQEGHGLCIRAHFLRNSPDWRCFGLESEDLLAAKFITAAPGDQATDVQGGCQQPAAYLVVQEQLLLRNRHAELGSDRLFDIEQCLLVLHSIGSTVTRVGISNLLYDALTAWHCAALLSTMLT